MALIGTSFERNEDHDVSSMMRWFRALSQSHFKLEKV